MSRSQQRLPIAVNREDAPVAIRSACIICATPRSGSWLLAEGLLGTGIAGRPEEYFRPDWYTRFASTGAVGYQHRLLQRDPWPPAPHLPPEGSANGNSRSFRAFVECVRRMATTDNGVASIKIHWNQFSDVLHILGREAEVGANPLASWFPNARYVFLRRQNKVRQAISHYRAIRSKRWCSNGDDGHDGIVDSADVDFHELERLRMLLVRHEGQWQEFFARMEIHPLELVYEEVAADPRAAVFTILRHLELDESQLPDVPEPRLCRQADQTTDLLEREYLVKRRSGLLDGPLHEGRTGPRLAVTRTAIIVADNFYADLQRVRDHALAADYYYPYEADASVAAGLIRPTWMSSRFKRANVCPFKSSQPLIELLEELTGETIDLDHWRGPFPSDPEGKPAPEHRLLADRTCVWNCCFHCKLESKQKLGEGVHNHVTDSWNTVGRDGWAGIIYLGAPGDDPPSGGLKLWRNRNLAQRYDWMTPKEQWELVDDLGNVPNRLILCRGDIPHSGAAGWGEDLLSGRLFQTFFFKTEKPLLRSSLVVPL